MESVDILTKGDILLDTEVENVTMSMSILYEVFCKYHRERCVS